ncbi:MAG: hypothetical protein K0R54_630 [Clostridiaceae bacterium]|jgi:hypothetical protein|nr:hypothetical protein [Clostridiaceae bacterium]
MTRIKINEEITEIETDITFDKILDSSIKNPSKILSNFCNEEVQNYILNYIEKYKNISLIYEFQERLYNILLPFLQNSFKDIVFNYDKTKYPALIKIIYNDLPIGHIDIFEKSFTQYSYLELDEVKEELQNVECKKIQINEKMTILEKYSENILSLGDKFLKKFVILFRQKSYKKKIMKEYMELVNKSLELDKTTVNLSLRIEKMENFIKPLELKQEYISNWFSSKHNYEIKK